MRWTQKQEKAINTFGQNILVAAAAGSGKTTVLIERIKNIILNRDENIRADVNSLLILTFTRAAASDMKKKLIKSIRKALRENPEDEGYLREQLNNIANANISTFHGFAQGIIKRYFYKVNINANFKIIDDIQGRLLKNKAIDNVFETNFNKAENKGFQDFLHSFGGSKNENRLKEELISFYDRLMASPKPFQLLNEKVNELRIVDENFKREIQSFTAERAVEALNMMIYAKEHIIDILGEYGCILTQEKEVAELSLLKNIVPDIRKKTPREINEIPSSLKPIRAGAGEKENFNEAKAAIEHFKKLLSLGKEKLNFLKEYSEYEDMYREIELTHKNAEILEVLINQIHMEFSALKREKNALDFSDIEHIAIRILEDEEIQKEYQRRFKYIFIDEYQDTNDTQEYIISLIKRRNNVFMVGDIKQSIYRFRMAEPELFEEKYRIYDDIDEQTKDSKGIKIDLNENFRSRKEIIDGINATFTPIMKGYDDNAKLHLGKPDMEILNEDEFLNRGVSMHVGRSKTGYKKDERDELNVMLREISQNKDIPIDLIKAQDLSDSEVEATIAAKHIKELIGQKIYDNGVERVISYRDIVILTRSLSNSEEYKEVLERCGIPVYVQNDKGYFDKLEVRLLLDLLKVIQNKNQDIHLMAVLTSPIFTFTYEEAGKIRLFRKEEKFYRAFRDYIKEGEDESLRNKCINAHKKLDEWRSLNRRLSLKEFIWELIDKSNIYKYASGLSNGYQRQINLRALADRANAYEEYGNGTLKGFLKYVESIEDRGIDVGEAKTVSESDDIVRITTIHSSKGLEYPVVILANTGKALLSARKAVEGSFFLSKKKGFFIKNVDLYEKKKFNNILHSIIAHEEKSKNIAEELRILYVAMTRAKEKLIVTGMTKDVYELRDLDMNEKTSYIQFIYETLSATDGVTVEENISSLDLLEFLPMKKVAQSSSETNAYVESPQIYEIIKKIRSFNYPYERDSKTKSKYTVSELNRDDMVKDRLDNLSLKRNIRKVAEEETITGAEVGTAYHRVMEIIDFENYKKIGTFAIIEAIDKAAAMENWSDGLKSKVEPGKIEKFFKSEIGVRAVGGKGRKEESFIMLYEKDGGKTIVQGIIDYYFEENGEMVIIDYKTNANTHDIKDRYREQMRLYKEALENATGKKVKEVWLYAFSKDEAIDMELV